MKLFPKKNPGNARNESQVCVLTEKTDLPVTKSSKQSDPEVGARG